MPIKKQNYPPNWPAISLQVRTEANFRCEWCNVPNLAIIKRQGANWKEVKTVLVPVLLNGAFAQETVYTAKMTWKELRQHGLTKIVLTVAHLDRNTMNNDRKNLAALCQKCHLNHDILQHLFNRRYGIDHAGEHQTKLF